MDPNKQPGIRFSNIFLVSETFERAPVFDEKYTLDISFEVKLFEQPNNLHGNELTTTLKCISEDDATKLLLEFTYVALFTVDKENENMDIRTFMQKNSSAYMMPYIRQHISSITGNGGISPILLPPLNIVAFMKD